MQGVAHRCLVLRVERAHRAHLSFKRIARNHFMTFFRQAERNASSISLRLLSDQIPTCLKRLDGLRCDWAGLEFALVAVIGSDPKARFRNAGTKDFRGRAHTCRLKKRISLASAAIS